MSQGPGFDELFADASVMAIFRGMGVARSVELSEQAWDLGITHVELPLQTEPDRQALEAVARLAADRGRHVGAGTILRPEQVNEAAEAGAAFLVSPGFDAAVAAAARGAGLPYLPGVATPTEIQAALAAGLSWLKAFPAAVLGTAWFTAMAGPFPQVKFVATGGLDAGNAGDFLAAGVRVVAVGSALADPAQLGRLSALIERDR